MFRGYGFLHPLHVTATRNDWWSSFSTRTVRLRISSVSQCSGGIIWAFKARGTRSLRIALLDEKGTKPVPRELPYLAGTVLR